MKKDNKNIYDKYASMESKPWFRFVKVTFILFAVLVFIAGSVILSEEKPYKEIDNTKSYVQCDKDKEAGLVYYLDKNNWDLYGEVDESEPSFDTYTEQAIRKACTQAVSGSVRAQLEEKYGVSKVNYKLYPTYQASGSYVEWLKYGVIFYGIFFFSEYLLIEAFFYIFTGKKMFKNISDYKDEE